MPVTIHSNARSSQQTRAVADTESEAPEAKKTKRRQKSRGINQFKDPRVSKVAEEASITIRQMTLFDNPFPEDVDEMAATAWITARGLWKFDDSVAQQPGLEHVAYTSPLHFLWYQ